ncbi:MAG TPA: prolyl oligopeptidase family serine peptidase [Longimicrobium sp.]
MRSTPSIGALVLLGIAAGGHAQAQPPVAPVRPVADTYHGTSVADPYRWMEEEGSTELRTWMLAQHAHTRAMIDRIPERDSLLARQTRYVRGSAVVFLDQRRGNRYFTWGAKPEDDFLRYYVRHGLGGEDRLVLDPSAYKVPGSTAAGAVTAESCEASPSGRRLLCELAAGGSEDGALFAIDVETGRMLDAPIPHASDPEWLPGERAFVYSRGPDLPPDAPATERNQNVRSYLHRLGSGSAPDRAVFGPGVWPGVVVDPTHDPEVRIPPGSRAAFVVVEDGTSAHVEVWTAPAAALTAVAPIQWRRIVRFEDQVTAFSVDGDALYLLTTRGAARKRLVRTSLAHPNPAAAEVVVPEGAGVFDRLVRTSDALYLSTMEAGSSRLLRVPLRGGATAPVPLPLAGSVRTFLGTDEAAPELVFQMDTWTREATDYRFDPSTGRVEAVGVMPPSPYSHLMDGYVSEEVMVPAADGVLIPLSIIRPRNLRRDGSAPTLLTGYGAYGTSLTPAFPGWAQTWFDAGGVYAVAHVRGGGELGEAWYRAGWQGTKPNSWRDFIACAEYLVREGYTSPARLAAEGASAGGILVGRAITERPDLFRAAVIKVGLADALRAETTANGVPNIPEFGSTATEEGFRALLAMSPYHHVRDGTPYPAVLLMTGMNDPRVNPWHAAKMAARLQAATTSGRPVLLRVDAEAGHFGGAMSSNLESFADEIAFLLWQLGQPGFQPSGEVAAGFRDGEQLDRT